jgi:predicted MPP superfamily phosphohydrolase
MKKMTRRKLFKAVAAAVTTPALVRAERRLAANEYFELTDHEVFLPGLDPAHDGLKVAHLTDLHIGHGVPDGRVIAAVRAVNEAQPDLVALTGDFVTSRRDPYDRVPQLLSTLLAPSVAVLGNHDHWSDAHEVASRLERVGIAVLRNQNTTLQVCGRDFTFVGVDDAATRHDDVEEALRGAAAGSRLLLTHTPSLARKLPAWAEWLVLAGHTHGGNWEIPGVTRNVFARAGQPWYRGFYRVRGNQLFVNRGLGFGKGTRLPRFNADPEVALLTLRASPRGA